MEASSAESQEPKGTHFPHSVLFSPDRATTSDFVVPLEVLGGSGQEQTRRSGVFKQGLQESGVTTLESEDELWLRIVRQESEGVPLEEVSFNAYRDLFASLQGRTGNLVRIWNYVPNILDKQGDLERYRRFNIGRREAWEQFGPKSPEGELLFPAATGIGSLGGGLRIEALFSPYPVTYLQNPRQVAPAQYSQKYGPRPPVFARGAILQKPDRTEFYISGTASILGEDVVHAGDPAAQTEESIRNIEILISEQNCRAHGFEEGFSLADLESLRVYIKNPSDLEVIRSIVESHISVPAIYLHDDICRKDLLVEIERVCSKPAKKLVDNLI